MIPRACFGAAVVAALAAFAAPADEAADLLAKAYEAMQSNLARQDHWNWNVHEVRRLVDKAGGVVQTFPTVDIESVIRNGGKRCNAVVAWGDGKKPFLVDADPERRCQAMEAIPDPFPLTALLRSRKVRIQAKSAGGVTLAVSIDKSRIKDADFPTRCAASIEATVRLDAATSFPVEIAGEVVESGCNQVNQPVSHYAARPAGPASSIFRKSARFHLEFVLQKDKFQNAANSFWVCARQQFDQPFDPNATYLYYWGRQVAVEQRGVGRRLIKEMHTTAREFGAETQLRFDK